MGPEGWRRGAERRRRRASGGAGAVTHCFRRAPSRRGRRTPHLASHWTDPPLLPGPSRPERHLTWRGLCSGRRTPRAPKQGACRGGGGGLCMACDLLAWPALLSWNCQPANLESANRPALPPAAMAAAISTGRARAAFARRLAGRLSRDRNSYCCPVILVSCFEYGARGTCRKVGGRASLLRRPTAPLTERAS